MQPKLARVFAALAREGLEVEGDGSAYTVRLASNPEGIRAEVLLPAGFPLEGAALRQLANLAAVAHPSGGRVARVCATPDFHPGDGRAGIAIGSVLGTEGLVVPAAVGTDINCGMRLHTMDIDVDRFQAGKRRFVDLMKGDLFYGRRDVPMAPRAMIGMFRDGVVGWLLELMSGGARGRMRLADLRQLDRDAQRVYLDGCLAGDESWAPDGLIDRSRDEIRDDGLATVGGGNHFLEIQVVDEIADRALAYEWGVRAGNLAFMIHSGSRKVGVHVGFSWSKKALEAWPAGVAHPASGIFPLCERERPDLVAGYLTAEATAANYGFVNRALLAELVRWRLREVFGEIEAPLVYDIPTTSRCARARITSRARAHAPRTPVSPSSSRDRWARRRTCSSGSEMRARYRPRRTARDARSRVSRFRAPARSSTRLRSACRASNASPCARSAASRKHPLPTSRSSP